MREAVCVRVRDVHIFIDSIIYKFYAHTHTLTQTNTPKYAGVCVRELIGADFGIHFGIGYMSRRLLLTFHSLESLFRVGVALKSMLLNSY